MLSLMGGQRLVVHPGATRNLERSHAVELCTQGLKEARVRLADEGLSHIVLCPETMGKKGQIGDLEETLAFCEADEALVPCIDFAHIHALGQGQLADTEAFAQVLDALESRLGMERARLMHVHFSTIEYGASGEKKHHTFAEPEYGPRFEHLAPLLVQRGYQATIICESKGTMAEDAQAMLAYIKRRWQASSQTAGSMVKSIRNTREGRMDRASRLIAQCALADSEAVIIHKPSNMRYLSGYTGEGMLVLSHGVRAIITDFRYTEQVGQQAPGWTCLEISTGIGHADLVGQVLKEHGLTSARTRTIMFPSRVTKRWCKRCQDMRLLRSIVRPKRCAWSRMKMNWPLMEKACAIVVPGL
jgi:hypothetical protein